MDWDEAKAKQPVKSISVGDDLSALSVVELDQRIAALEAEIGRIRTERASKLARNAAADQLFKR
jgi:uncharacterized small protein (DUF1192 family)